MPSSPSLARLGELGFLRQLLPRLQQRGGVIVGPGDDCAVVRGARTTLLTTDALVEGVHFERGWMTPEEIGRKAMLVNLSDIAAMGGRPQYALVSVGVPGDCTRAELADIHRGCERAARAAAVSIVGGNLSTAERLFLSVTLVGAAEKPVLRRGAKPGDLLFVTGTLGDAAAAVHLWKLQASQKSAAAARRAIPPALRRRFASPAVRLDVGRRLAASGIASAMIDVSDGLVQDLGHICTASDVGAVVSIDRVPRSRAYRDLIGPDLELALAGGEDYELLFTVPPRRLRRLHALKLPVRLSLIGEIRARPRGVRLRDASGRLRRARDGGHQHFRVVGR